ncbi:MAG: glycosyltransferase family 2 protein [bacterium]|nr:glycosyltransferase family 2 protein [bacterium]
MNTSPTLSVVLATYNEEKNLPACLESVKDLADEIIIVDGSSTDRTVEIAKQFTSNVTTTDNPPIFHINKQKAIDKATKDWVLQLDADERVSDELKKEILKIRSLRDDYNGYFIPRKNLFLGRYLTKGGQYPDGVIRLFRKGKGRLPCKSVHEQVVVNGSVGWLKNPLIHQAYPTFQDYLRRQETYTKLEAMEMKQKGVSPSIGSWLFYTLWKPLTTFLSLYIRHKGFLDSWQGFVFALFSGIHFAKAYRKFLRQV